jgi:uncharacterized protein
MMTEAKMRVVILGGSGLIGAALAKSIAANGNEAVIVSRRPERTAVQPGISSAKWDGETPDGWQPLLEGALAVVNLAGENIGAKLWSAERKEQLISSRVRSGKALMNALELTKNRPEVLVQASAVGYYGTSLTQTFVDDSPIGADFLAGICREWEAATQDADQLGMRRLVIRTGVVLDARHGALPRMVIPFCWFVGGPLGSGRQWLPWIHLQDEVEAIRYLIENQQANGAYILSSPNPMTNAEFGRALGAVLRRPYWAPVPGFAMKAVLGEMSTLVLDGQKALPEKLTRAGYAFRYPTLKPALEQILR